MKLLLSLLCIFILSSFILPWQWDGLQATGNVYYVSFSGGNDANTGLSPSLAVKTLSKINSMQSAGTIANGSTVLLKAGDTWALDTLLVSKGISIDSYGSGAQPTISGFYPITSWTSLGNGIYESEAMPTNSAVNMVTINNVEYAMGRYPNADASNGGYLTYEAVGSGSISDNTGKPASVDSATWAGAMVVIRVNHYVLDRSNITDINGNTILYSPSLSTTPTANFGYFLENSIKALDQFGEWYYNPNTKKLDVYFGSAGPTGYTVKASAKNVLLRPTASNTSVNNIHFEGANQYGIWDWSSNGVTGLNITNCKFDFSGIDAISMEWRAGLVIDHCTTNWSNGNSICMANRDKGSVVTNNVLGNTGTFPGMLQRSQFSSNRYGIAICHIPSEGFTGMTCLNNKIYNVGGHGILFYGDTVLVQNNEVYNHCMVMDDDGGIYTANQAMVPRKNVMILNNIVGNASSAGAFGTSGSPNPPASIYLDDGTINVTVMGNTTYSNHSGYGIYIHNVQNSTIKYNLSYDNNWQVAFIHGTQVSMAMDSNILIGNKLFCLNASQKVQYRAKDASFSESFASYTHKCDSNYYCSPFTSESNSLQTNWFGNSTTNYNLTTWKSATGLDAHSVVTPTTITDPADVLLEVNTAGVTKRYGFCSPMLDLDNTVLRKSTNVNSFASTILIQNHAGQ
jgi:hypothetical protein